MPDCVIAGKVSFICPYLFVPRKVMVNSLLDPLSPYHDGTPSLLLDLEFQVIGTVTMKECNIFLCQNLVQFGEEIIGGGIPMHLFPYASLGGEDCGFGSCCQINECV